MQKVKSPGIGILALPGDLEKTFIADSPDNNIIITQTINLY